MSKSNRIYITEMTQNPNGSFDIVLRDGRTIKGLGMCFDAREEECDDSFFYEIYFEKVKNNWS